MKSGDSIRRQALTVHSFGNENTTGAEIRSLLLKSSTPKLLRIFSVAGQALAVQKSPQLAWTRPKDEQRCIGLQSISSTTFHIHQPPQNHQIPTYRRPMMNSNTVSSEANLGYRTAIVPGFNPDPSMIKVGSDYFLITSSFEYFPGIPIYHSTDLVNWKLINHVLTRRSQLDLRTVEAGGGIFAPTIREHRGRIYVTCCQMQKSDSLGGYKVS